MKKALKIFFIIVAIAVMVVGIYFVFFDVDRRHSVYHDVSNVMTHKYNIDLYGDLSGLNELGVNDNTEVITEDNYPQLYAIRNRLFVVDEEAKLVHGSQEAGYFYYYGYAKYETIITDGINYYCQYASLADNADKAKANRVGSVVREYKTSMNKLYNEADAIAKEQSKLGKLDSGVTEDSVVAMYNTLRLSYRDYLSKASKLLISVRDFVIEEAFDNEFYFETIAILYDSVAETINTAMNAPIEQEINYLHDASVYADKYYIYLDTSEIAYGISDEINYLLAYNKLYFKDREDYNRLFSLTHFQKEDLLLGNNSISAQFNIGYLESAQIVVALSVI